MTKFSVAKYILLCLLIIGVLAFAVSAISPTDFQVRNLDSGFNLTNSNGSSAAIKIIVNVSVRSGQYVNITNISVYIHSGANRYFINSSNNGTGALSNGTPSNGTGAVGQYNFTLTTTSFNDGFRNYTINVTVTEANGSGASQSNITNLTIDNTAPTITLNTPTNLTNTTAGTLGANNSEFNFTVTDAITNLLMIPSTNGVKFACTLLINGAANVTNTTTLNQTITNMNATHLAVGIILWAVNCTDNVGIQSSTENQTLVIDSTLPRNANLTFSTSSVPYGDAVSITCAGSDNLNGASNLIPGLNITIKVKVADLSSFSLKSEVFTSNKSITFEDTRALGSYDVNCSVTDGVGNINSTLRTFEVVSKPSAEGFVPTEKAVAKIIIGSGKVADYGALSDEAVSRLMATDSTLRFTIGTDSHEIIVKSLTETTAVLTIQSEPFDLSMNIKDKKDVDLNKDGINDITIELHNIIRGKADLTITKLKAGESSSTPVNVPTTSGNQNTGNVAPTEQGSNTMLIILIILAILLALIYVFLKFRGGKGNVSFSSKDLGSGRDGTYSYPAKQQQTYPVMKQEQPVRQPIRNGMNLKENLTNEEQIRRTAFYTDRFKNQ